MKIITLTLLLLIPVTGYAGAIRLAAKGVKIAAKATCGGVVKTVKVVKKGVC